MPAIIGFRGRGACLYQIGECNENFKGEFIRRLVNYTDEELCGFLNKGSNEAFSEIYERYWERLYRYAFNRVNSDDAAFEITQEIFLSLWARKRKIVFHTSLSGYLYASLKYQIVRYIKSGKLRSDYLRDLILFHSSRTDNSNEQIVNLHELENAVEKSLKSLPKRCQEIFKMSRQENKTIKEISEQLSLSHKTVENQITLALKHLRVSLGEFMVVPLLAAFSFLM